MFTYQLQNRVLRVDRELRFPADVKIEVRLAPPQPFGAASGGSRTGRQAVPAQVLYDSNTGRATIASEQPLSPVDVTVHYDNEVLSLKGDVFRLSRRIETLAELHDHLLSLVCGIPLFLNADFADPPFIVSVQGVVGGVPFRWELAEVRLEFDITTTERQEERVQTMITRLATFGTTNRQVVAALHYFHRACRLLAAGSSPWEFMAETVLNFAKVLQALFGESMDQARDGLRGLGYDAAHIEKFFIPAMALRSHIDVGHVMISVLKQTDLLAIYRYLGSAEQAFRELLHRVLEQLAAGALTFPEVTELAADRDKRRVVDRIVAAWGGTRDDNPIGDA